MEPARKGRPPLHKEAMNLLLNRNVLVVFDDSPVDPTYGTTCDALIGFVEAGAGFDSIPDLEAQNDERKKKNEDADTAIFFVDFDEFLQKALDAGVLDECKTYNSRAERNEDLAGRDD